MTRSTIMQRHSRGITQQSLTDQAIWPFGYGSHYLCVCVCLFQMRKFDSECNERFQFRCNIHILQSPKSGLRCTIRALHICIKFTSTIRSFDHSHQC